jgi:hypothetical protein
MASPEETMQAIAGELGIPYGRSDFEYLLDIIEIARRFGDLPPHSVKGHEVIAALAARASTVKGNWAP